VFWRMYGLSAVGLRYFNVFGPRQDPEGPYAAVIPRWVAAMIHNQPAVVHGDGQSSRDFCYVANVVQANLLAALSVKPGVVGQVFNVALNECTTLIELFEMIRCKLLPDHPHLRHYRPHHRDFRLADIRHSRADISRAQTVLGYEPTHTVEQGLTEALGWYKRNLAGPAAVVS
jgi:UDP-N-acetylglucosamine/UDP-N-acetylgalactosamine 4-epimerase